MLRCRRTGLVLLCVGLITACSDDPDAPDAPEPAVLGDECDADIACADDLACVEVYFEADKTICRRPCETETPIDGSVPTAECPAAGAPVCINGGCQEEQGDG